MLRPPQYLALAALALGSPALAASVEVTGGQTSVALDTATLAAAANLNLSGVSERVIVPGDLPGSVAFGIVDTTTFAYDSDDFLGSFSGQIDHQGSVFFNDDSVEVGDFTIGFDADRAGTLSGAASGFFVESTTGIAAVLFDVAAPSALDASDSALGIDADLLVSPEFGAFLQNAGLASSNLAGADVGDARVSAAVTVVPSPTAAAAGLFGLALLGARRRRRG